ncbi:hypothetical protein WG66_004379 [Moniliophthora roreri]|nr:hypothetical protein WG66_004379 [Moniliophthora roreri]
MIHGLVGLVLVTLSVASVSVEDRGRGPVIRAGSEEADYEFLKPTADKIEGPKYLAVFWQPTHAHLKNIRPKRMVQLPGFRIEGRELGDEQSQWRDQRNLGPRNINPDASVASYGVPLGRNAWKPGEQSLTKLLANGFQTYGYVEMPA